MIVELNVPFVEKDEAKRLGAKWNANNKTWYVVANRDLTPFSRWLPEGTITVASDSTTLVAFLGKVGHIIQCNLPTPEWIVAEISEYRTNNGHAFITLVEHDEQGELLARARASIWKSELPEIQEKFTLATSAELTEGIKVMVLARAEFHQQYGFTLHIDDIDPNYTLGDMAAKLAKIRELLIKENIFQQNKHLTKPQDFSRVAVISPHAAAGLGDFKREASLIADCGLCEFDYLTATFQGRDASSSIRMAIEQVIANYQLYDCLVIIRGGGAVSDLAWLNDEQLARSLCLAPLPILVGIGHKRDHTILDEIAHESLDTPSKVINRIFQQIVRNAEQAQVDFEQIYKFADNLYLQVSNQLQLYCHELSSRSDLLIAQNNTRLQKIVNEVQDYAMQQVYQSQEEIYQALNILVNRINLQIRDGETLIQRLLVQVNDKMVNVQDKLDNASDAIIAEILNLGKISYNNVEKQLVALLREILGQGPENVLQKGYALVTNLQGKAISSYDVAKSNSQFRLQFHDGKLLVENIGEINE